MEKYDIIIVGGGPAGLLAAIRAAQIVKKVIILEKKNSPGKKLLISGKGRCNLTNAVDTDGFLENFGKTREFLRSAFSALSNKDLIAFFENKGVKLKTERGNRVFPESDRSSSILNSLKFEVRLEGVKILCNSRVSVIEKKQGSFRIVLEDGKSFSAKKAILACGGLSYPDTGSTGDGYKIAESLGHKIIPLQPGLVPLETQERWVKDISGLSLKNVQIKLLTEKKPIVSEIGEMLFTHFGLSGPLVLTLSGKVAELLSNCKSPVKLTIDLKPALTAEKLNSRLIRDFKALGVKSYKNVLKELLPGKLVDVFVKLSGIDRRKQVSQITAKERKKISSLLKALPLTITKSRPIEEAIVTKGGVSTKEINPRTMESKLIEGLYFCGEVIDVDANTGGYNMQAAFSTGFLAGESAAKSLEGSIDR